MNLKYSPQYAAANTIEVVDENTIKVDGESYAFQPDAVAFPDVANQTGVILEAHREGGELFLTVLRRYNHTTSAPEWDDVQYHQVSAGVIQ